MAVSITSTDTTITITATDENLHWFNISAQLNSLNDANNYAVDDLIRITKSLHLEGNRNLALRNNTTFECLGNGVTPRIGSGFTEISNGRVIRGTRVGLLNIQMSNNRQTAHHYIIDNDVPTYLNMRISHDNSAYPRVGIRNTNVNSELKLTVSSPNANVPHIYIIGGWAGDNEVYIENASYTPTTPHYFNIVEAIVIAEFKTLPGSALGYPPGGYYFGGILSQMGSVRSDTIFNNYRGDIGIGTTDMAIHPAFSGWKVNYDYDFNYSFTGETIADGIGIIKSGTTVVSTIQLLDFNAGDKGTFDLVRLLQGDTRNGPGGSGGYSPLQFESFNYTEGTVEFRDPNIQFFSIPYSKQSGVGAFELAGNVLADDMYSDTETVIDFSLDELYDILKQELSATKSAAIPVFFSLNGSELVLDEDWSLVLSFSLSPASININSVNKQVDLTWQTLVSGTKITSLKATGAGTITSTQGVTISAEFTDSASDSVIPFASNSSIQSWSIHPTADDSYRDINTSFSGTGTNFLFNYESGTTYYIRILVGGVPSYLEITPAQAGRQEITLGNSAILNFLISQNVEIRGLGISLIEQNTGISGLGASLVEQNNGISALGQTLLNQNEGIIGLGNNLQALSVNNLNAIQAADFTISKIIYVDRDVSDHSSPNTVIATIDGNGNDLDVTRIGGTKENNILVHYNIADNEDLTLGNEEGTFNQFIIRLYNKSDTTQTVTIKTEFVSINGSIATDITEKTNTVRLLANSQETATMIFNFDNLEDSNDIERIELEISELEENKTISISSIGAFRKTLKTEETAIGGGGTTLTQTEFDALMDGTTDNIKNAYKADASTAEITTIVSNTQANLENFIFQEHDQIFEQIGALNDFNPNEDTVARVTLVDTTATNTDMRGTDNANIGNIDDTAIINAINELNNFNPAVDNVNLSAATITQIAEEVDLDLSEIEASPSLLLKTTVQTVVNQTQIVLTDGATFDTYVNQIVKITSRTNTLNQSYVYIKSYDSDTRTLTLTTPMPFTINIGDTVDIIIIFRTVVRDGEISVDNDVLEIGVDSLQKSTTAGLSASVKDRFNCVKVGETLRVIFTFTNNEVIDESATAEFTIINDQTDESIHAGSVESSILSIPENVFTKPGVYYLNMLVNYSNGEVRKPSYKLRVFS